MNRFSKTSLKVVGMGTALALLSGCGGMASALGVSKSAPDEFAVVKKAPLVMPPDYTLRPPKPGAPRPQELRPSQTARQALLGNAEGGQVNQSEGETQLLINANADQADPNIRSVLDDEGGKVKSKDQAFADQVIFTEPSGQASALPVADVSTEPLDAPGSGGNSASSSKDDEDEEKKGGFWKKVTGGVF